MPQEGRVVIEITAIYVLPPQPYLSSFRNQCDRKLAKIDLIKRHAEEMLAIVQQ
jgi:hypothetical protein